MKRILFFFLKSVVLVLTLFRYDTGYAASVGDLAPEFSLENINSKDRLSLKELQGKIVLINFWATWCAPCKKELPELDRLSKENKTGNLAVLAINIDKDVGNAKKFLDYYPVSIPVLLDSDANVVSKYGAMAMPTSFILDEKGIIKFVHLGFSEGDPVKWRQEIGALSTKK